MLNAIIIAGIVGTHNRHRHNYRTDSLVTIRHLEGHSAEVRVCICELVSGKTHVGRTHNCSGCCGCTTEGEVVVHIVQCRAGCRCVTVHTMFSAIVSSGVVSTCDGHRHIYRTDGLITIRHVKGHVAKVVIRICELTYRKTHVGRTHNCSGCCRRATETEVSFGI